MSPANPIRWSGLALALGGIPIAGFVIALIPIDGFASDPEKTGNGTYLVAHGLHTVGGGLALFGLVGLFVRQLGQAGRLGLIAFWWPSPAQPCFSASGW